MLDPLTGGGVGSILLGISLSFAGARWHRAQVFLTGQALVVFGIVLFIVQVLRYWRW